jgi:transposase-like protein
VGITQFEELCQRFEKSYPRFMAELRKKRDHYLAFLKYPDAPSAARSRRPIRSKRSTVNWKKSAVTAADTFNRTIR